MYAVAEYSVIDGFVGQLRVGDGPVFDVGSLYGVIGNFFRCDRFWSEFFRGDGVVGQLRVGDGIICQFFCCDGIVCYSVGRDRFWSEFFRGDGVVGYLCRLYRTVGNLRRRDGAILNIARLHQHAPPANMLYILKQLQHINSFIFSKKAAVPKASALGFSPK